MPVTENGARGERTVPLRIVVTPMPPRACGTVEDLELVLQDGAGVQPGVGRDDGAMVFETRVRVRPNAATGSPNFLGPNVNGTPDQRFVYLRWEGIEDGHPKLVGRMKIHLSSVTWEQIEEAADGGELEATVSGVSDRGRFACASVPLLGEGWRVVGR